MIDPLEDEVFYPQGLVLVPRGGDDDSVVVGSHMRGSRLRASSAGDEEVDLLLPGTARYGFLDVFGSVCLIFRLNSCKHLVLAHALNKSVSQRRYPWEIKIKF